MTGEIEELHEERVILNIKQCEYCHQDFECKKDRKFCSMLCLTKSKKKRVEKKPKVFKKVKVKYTGEIVPTMRLKVRTKMPHFVKDPHQWANTVYGRWKSRNREPKKSSSEYGLYKYGEWLADNEMFETMPPYEKT